MYVFVVDDIYEHHVMLYGCLFGAMSCCSSISFCLSSLMALCMLVLVSSSCISCHASFVIYLGG